MTSCSRRDDADGHDALSSGPLAPSLQRRPRMKSQPCSLSIMVGLLKLVLQRCNKNHERRDLAATFLEMGTASCVSGLCSKKRPSKVSSTRHHSRSGNRSGCLMTKTRRHSRREVRQPSGPGRRQDMCIGEAPICISSPAVEEWWVRELRPRPSYRNVLQIPVGQNRHGHVLFVHELTCRARFSETARRLDSGCCMVKTR